MSKEVERPASEGALPVGSILKTHLEKRPGPWCREILLYSPDNQGDSPEQRVMVYTAGRLSDALDYAEKGLAGWRAQAQANARHAEAARATARVAIGHLQRVLQDTHARIPSEQRLQWRRDAEDWLASIGADQ